MHHYSKLPPLNFDYLLERQPFVLLETNKFSPENRFSYLFSDPIQILRADVSAEIPAVFEQIDRLSQEHFLAGFLSFELGYAFEKKLRPGPETSWPLAWFGVFENPIVFDHRSGQFEGPMPELTASVRAEDYQLSDVRLAISKQDYVARIARIKRFIEAGDTYQVNFTTRYEFGFRGSPFQFHADLKCKQEVAYNAFIKFDDACIISLSPELFFRKTGNRMLVRPMKGTLARGRTLAEDSQRAARLAQDKKNRSENVMIVDLLRNDLGRISEPGSVRVSDLFSVEKYNTLFQMTSTVASTLNDDLSYSDIFRSIFPCGSVTGAPKIRTMQIIQELEEEPRAVYTGAIGYISPGGDALFNVPIRTITIRGNRGEMGVGSGIIYDSDPEDEYDECRLKARFLVEEYRAFSLIETILWQGEFVRLHLHLARLQDSARYFDFYFDEMAVLDRLRRFEQSLSRDKRYKIRLLLGKDGSCSLSSTPVESPSVPTARAVISLHRTSSKDRFLFHKTTNRDLYNKEFKCYSKAGYRDVIFTNERAEVTEGAISNIFVRLGKWYFTPPIECGLLNGTFRQDFLAGHANVSERILYVDDLLTADAVYLTNAIREMTEVSVEKEVSRR